MILLNWEYNDTLTLYKNRLVQVYQTASRHEVGELFTLKVLLKGMSFFEILEECMKLVSSNNPNSTKKCYFYWKCYIDRPSHWFTPDLTSLVAGSTKKLGGSCRVTCISVQLSTWTDHTIDSWPDWLVRTEFSEIDFFQFIVFSLL